MPQKPVFVPDDKFTPDENFTPDTEPVSNPAVVPQQPTLPPAQPSFLSNAWHTLSDPLTNLPSRMAKGVSDWMGDVPIEQENGQGGFHDYFANANAKARGFFQGATEGLGHIADSLTSPLSIATLGAGGLEYGAGKAGLESIANLANTGTKLLSAPVAAHGAATLLDPNSSWGERGMGLTELAGGGAGMFHTPPAAHSAVDTPSPNPPKLSEIGGSVVKGKTDIAPINETNPGFFDRMPPDPNFHAGEGDAELAGSQPYTAPEPVPPTKPTMQTAPMGQKIIIRKEGATPDVIKKAKEAGFEFDGLNDQGNFRFTKTKEPAEQPILESEVGETRPTMAGVKQHLGPLTDTKRANPLVEAYNLPRGIMASMDFSAPLRQGIGLIHKKEFWTALKPMFESWRTEEGFRASQQAIAERPLFRERAGPNGKVLPSFADDAGLKLTDLSSLSNREEALMSTWAESGFRFGKEGSKLFKTTETLSKPYAATVGKGVRMSNRAYTAFLNNLRADTFENLVKDGKIFGADAKVNLPLARELANFVNTATGRGSLGKLESSAVALNSVLFSPRLISSRLQMLNPAYYIMASPQVRKEAIKSLFAIAAAGNVVTQLGKMAGGTVSMDPTSSDFGKLKIGNTRVDPYGGFQQYIVAASRLLSGKVTSSTTGNEYDLNNPQGPYDPTHADVATRFARGKVHPVLGFIWSLMSGKKEMSGKPMDFTTMNPMENAVAQRFIPILLQDFNELAKSDELPPELKAIVGTLSTFGMGTQTYDGSSQ